MKSLSHLLHKADLFGKPFIFEEKNHNKFTTIYGIIMTFLIVVTCIVIGFLFGKEIYERKSPTVISADDKLLTSTIKVSEFPILFGFIDGPGRNLAIAPKHIKMEITFLTLSEDLVPKIYYHKGYTTCKSTDFPELYQPYVEKMQSANVNMFCINQDDLYFQNDFISPNSAYINVRFIKCDSSIYEGCDDQDEMNAMLKDFYILTMLVDSYADPNNYDSPFNYFVKNSSLKMSDGLLQRNYFNIERRKLITHKGWMLENIKEEEYFALRSTVNEVSTAYNGNLYWVTLSSPNIRNKIIRSYMKVQDMLAKIGGFFNALFIAILLLTKDYVDFTFYSYIYSHFIANNKGRDKRLISHSSTLKKKTTIDKVIQKMIRSNITYDNMNNSILKDNISNPKLHNINAKLDDKTNNNDINNEISNNVNNNFNNNSYNNNNNNNIINSNSQGRSKKNVNLSLGIAMNNQISPNNNQSHDRINNINSHNINNSKIQLFNNYVSNSVIHNDNNNINNEDHQNHDNQDININKYLNVNNINSNNINSNNINTVNKGNTLKSNINQTSDNISKNNNKFINDTISKINFREMSYFSYFWNDLICGRKKFVYQRKAVGKIISFDNLIELSYEYFLKQEEIHEESE